MLGKRALRDSEKKLLVIDLNGVLLDGDAMKTERFGKEPLLTLLFSKYHVISWTSQRRWKLDPAGVKKPQPKGESRVKWAFGKWRFFIFHRLWVRIGRFLRLKASGWDGPLRLQRPEGESYDLSWLPTNGRRKRRGTT